MVSANELRIGNYFQYGKNKVQTTVFDFTYDRHDGHLINGIPESSISGILLTPEWFGRFNALQNNQPSEWQWLISISAIKIKFRKNYGILYSELGGIYLGDKIQYVHQLQNLYFALTGQELCATT